MGRSPGVNVTAFDSERVPVTFAGTSTGTDGVFLLTGLAPSAVGYTVCFDGSQATGGPSGSGYLDQCYQDVPWDGSTSPVGGRPVQVAAGATTPGVDGSLPSAGGVSGAVTGGGAGVLSAYADVFDDSGNLVRSVSTGTDGTYNAPGLPLSAAGYTVCFDAAYVIGPTPPTGYADQCYKDVGWSGPRGSLPAGTSSVAVQGGVATTGVDAHLTPAGALSGTVTAAADGAGLETVVVDVYDSEGHQLGNGFTAQDGSYTVGGLTPPASGYTVCFDASGALGGSSVTGYLSQCYRDVPWSGVPPAPAGVTAVPVSGGQTVTGIDASLAAG